MAEKKELKDFELDDINGGLDVVNLGGRVSKYEPKEGDYVKTSDCGSNSVYKIDSIVNNELYCSKYVYNTVIRRGSCVASGVKLTANDVKAASKPTWL